MDLTIIAIGKMKKTSPEKELIDTYIKQCGWNIQVVELEEKRNLTGLALKKAEYSSRILSVSATIKTFILLQDFLHCNCKLTRFRHVFLQNKCSAFFH